MIEFKEIIDIEFSETLMSRFGLNDFGRVFSVTENGQEIGAATYISGEAGAWLRLKAVNEPIKDFLFRSMLNVYAWKDPKQIYAATGIWRKIVIILEPDTVNYLGMKYVQKFGFKKTPDGSFTVKTKDIKLKCGGCK